MTFWLCNNTFRSRSKTTPTSVVNTVNNPANDVLKIIVYLFKIHLVFTIYVLFQNVDYISFNFFLVSVNFKMLFLLLVNFFHFRQLWYIDHQTCLFPFLLYQLFACRRFFVTTYFASSHIFSLCVICSPFSSFSFISSPWRFLVSNVFKSFYIALSFFPTHVLLFLSIGDSLHFALTRDDQNGLILMEITFFSRFSRLYVSVHVCSFKEYQCVML